MTPVEALTRIRALCEAIYNETTTLPTVRLADQVLQVVHAVSVDATPSQGIDRDALRESLVVTISNCLHSSAEVYDPEVFADRILALVRPVEGVVLSPEEVALALAALRSAPATADGKRTPAERALAARLEAAR